MTLLEFFNLLEKTEIPVWHYEATLEEYPYIVYQELTTDFSWASGKPYEEHTQIAVEHYTKNEFDPSLERLKRLLIKNKVPFTISTAYNHETKVILNQFSLKIKHEWKDTDDE
ncbi:MAG: hypothetical protein FWC13_05335 [Oscillospiraceae bacterium]|nr:hypothetical protein [Oscillospiraceae bacterium]